MIRRYWRAATFKPNPWSDINTWREFKWDMQHPRQLLDNCIAGGKGENPRVPPSVRWAGFGLMCVGALNVFGGIAMIVRGTFF